MYVFYYITTQLTFYFLLTKQWITVGNGFFSQQVSCQRAFDCFPNIRKIYTYQIRSWYRWTNASVVWIDFMIILFLRISIFQYRIYSVTKTRIFQYLNMDLKERICFHYINVEFNQCIIKLKTMSTIMFLLWTKPMSSCVYRPRVRAHIIIVIIFTLYAKWI